MFSLNPNPPCARCPECGRLVLLSYSRDLSPGEECVDLTCDANPKNHHYFKARRIPGLHQPRGGEEG